MYVLVLLLLLATAQHKLDAAYCYRRSSVVSLSVSRSGTTVSAAKAEPIVITFGMDSGGPKEACIRWGSVLCQEIAWEERLPIDLFSVEWDLKP